MADPIDALFALNSNQPFYRCNTSTPCSLAAKCARYLLVERTGTVTRLMDAWREPDGTCRAYLDPADYPGAEYQSAAERRNRYKEPPKEVEWACIECLRKANLLDAVEKRFVNVRRCQVCHCPDSRTYRAEGLGLEMASSRVIKEQGSIEALGIRTILSDRIFVVTSIKRLYRFPSDRLNVLAPEGKDPEEVATRDIASIHIRPTEAQRQWIGWECELESGYREWIARVKATEAFDWNHSYTFQELYQFPLWVNHKRVKGSGKWKEVTS